MKFVIGGTLTILSWANPVTAFFRKSKKLRHSLGRPSRSDFVQFEFVIPPIDEQQRIVSILDRFDALCNDISAGLPAEIEARQKQYEYYRDKLLNFKEMSV